MLQAPVQCPSKYRLNPLPYRSPLENLAGLRRGKYSRSLRSTSQLPRCPVSVSLFWMISTSESYRPSETRASGWPVGIAGLAIRVGAEISAGIILRASVLPSKPLFPASSADENQDSARIASNAIWLCRSFHKKIL